jgi:hypothetical protein
MTCIEYKDHMLDSRYHECGTIVYRHELLTVTALEHPRGTVYDLLGSLSQVAVPEDATLMNLYWKVVPAGRVIVEVHRGFVLVYLDAESAGAEFAFQLPSWEMDPMTLMVCPTLVVASSLNVTATFAAGVHVGVAEVVVVVGCAPDPEVIRMSAQFT